MLSHRLNDINIRMENISFFPDSFDISLDLDLYCSSPKKQIRIQPEPSTKIDPGTENFHPLHVLFYIYARKLYKLRIIKIVQLC